MRHRLCRLTLIALLLSRVAVEAATPHDEELKSAAGLPLADRIAREVESAITAGNMPGCVVHIERRGRVIHREAYGLRQIEPISERMTLDTVFDLASLTKPMVTATSVMILVERGKLRLDDPVARHLPEFAAHGKDAIRIEHLLLHTGGLIADNPLDDYGDGHEKAIERIFALKPLAPPQERFIYSDVGYMVLGLVVERVSGTPLDDFAHDNIFKPLAMDDTAFRPQERLRGRAAPTEKRNGQWLKGEVHDPRAARLGGVAGHAGVFSTSEDVARFARMMLGRGRTASREVLNEQTWRTMTTPRDVPRGRRALGWDMATGYSTNRGNKLSDVAFGHGGFTGTSLWIDPEKQLFVIFLSNRLHPDGKGTVNPLAGRIAEIVVESSD